MQTVPNNNVTVMQILMLLHSQSLEEYNSSQHDLVPQMLEMRLDISKLLISNNTDKTRVF